MVVSYRHHKKGITKANPDKKKYGRKGIQKEDKENVQIRDREKENIIKDNENMRYSSCHRKKKKTSNQFQTRLKCQSFTFAPFVEECNAKPDSLHGSSCSSKGQKVLASVVTDLELVCAAFCKVS